MAMIGLTLAGTSVFESATDPDKGTPQATRFTLGTVDMNVMSTVLDKALVFRQSEPGDQATQVRQNEVNIDLVRHGLRGWERFLDAKGNEIEFKTVKARVAGKAYDVVSDDSLAVLGLQLIAELANEIRKQNVPDRGEEKNSGLA